MRQQATCPVLRKAETFGAYLTATAELGCYCENTAAARRSMKRILCPLIATVSDIGQMTAEGLKGCECPGDVAGRAAVADDGAGQVVKRASARMQIDREISSRQQRTLNVVRDHCGR